MEAKKPGQSLTTLIWVIKNLLQLCHEGLIINCNRRMVLDNDCGPLCSSIRQKIDNKSNLQLDVNGWRSNTNEHCNWKLVQWPASPGQQRNWVCVPRGAVKTMEMPENRGPRWKPAQWLVGHQRLTKEDRDIGRELLEQIKTWVHFGPIILPTKIQGRTQKCRLRRQLTVNKWFIYTIFTIVNKCAQAPHEYNSKWSAKMKHSAVLVGKAKNMVNWRKEMKEQLVKDWITRSRSLDCSGYHWQRQNNVTQDSRWSLLITPIRCRWEGSTNKRWFNHTP